MPEEITQVPAAEKTNAEETVISAAEEKQKGKKPLYRNPWLFITTLYFAQGLPYFLVNTLPIAMYKDLGIDNQTITFWTGLFGIPWSIKMFWGPMVDKYSTKRNWIVYTQLIMAILFGVIAFIQNMPSFFILSIVTFFSIAFVSATHDIAADGFYLLSLDKEKQSFFAGIRTAAYRTSGFFSDSFLLWFAGFLIVSVGLSVQYSWAIAYVIPMALFILLFLYHKFILPYPAEDYPKTKLQRDNTTSAAKIFKEYFKQPKVAIVIGFILTFRMGEAFIIKIAIPFLKDPVTNGGLGFTSEQVGIINAFALSGFLIGGLLGGFAISKHGFKKWLWPMALIINIPTISYAAMSFIKPVGYYNFDFSLFAFQISQAVPFVVLEKFSYGFGYSVLMIYLMYITRGEYKTSHFAISTGISFLGLMIPGMISGWLQGMMGYQSFFILTVLLGIPGIIILAFLPFDDSKK